MIKKIRWYVISLLLLLLLIAIPVCAIYMPDDEVDLSYDDPTMDLFDLCSAGVPDHGEFTNGSSGWTITTTRYADVISYTDSTEGWVGLRCSSANTASIEFGPIYVSKTLSGSPRPSFDWDMLFLYIHFRGNPSSPYNSRIAGQFKVELFDAIGSELYTVIGYDASSAAALGYYPVVGVSSTGTGSPMDWACYSWQLTPIHQNWYKISKLKMTYSVPDVLAIPSTEIQIDQIYLFTYLRKTQ